MHRGYSNNHDAGRLLLPFSRPIWSAVFLLFIVLLHGCSTVPSSTSDTTVQQQSSQEVAHPFHTKAETQDGAFTITLDITPDRIGTNVFTAYVVNTNTGKATTGVQVTFYITMQDMAMGTNAISLQDEGQGHFRATENTLSMAGHWTIGIAIQTMDHIIHKVGVSFVTFP